MAHSDGPRGQIRGMALSSMPELWLSAVAFAGLLIIVSTAPPMRAAPRDMAKQPRLHAFALAAALAVDVSKTSTLGFVLPGMRSEYGLDPSAASLLPAAGLIGATAGAVAVKYLSPRIGNSRIYLLATLSFASTSCCAMMPTFAANVVMCFLMGISVGALAPMLITAIRDHCAASGNSSMAITVSVAASAFGFLIAAGAAAWLIPEYGWRVMWLIGVPTGLALACLTWFVPDLATEWSVRPHLGHATALNVSSPNHLRLYNLFAFVTGLVSFGVATWAPTLGGTKADGSSGTLVWVSIALVPAAFLIGSIHRRRGARSVLSIVAASAGVVLIVLALAFPLALPSWLLTGAFVSSLFAVNALASLLLPTASTAIKGPSRTSVVATVSAWNRVGGLTGPVILAGLVESPASIVSVIAALGGICVVLGFITSRVLQQEATHVTAEKKVSSSTPQ